MKYKGMVDVGRKKISRRIAVSESFIRIPGQVLEKIKNSAIKKGNALETARLAGIIAAKNTARIIPLCHNIAVEHVGVEFEFEKEGINIRSVVKSNAKTGVEMESLIAVSVAALTIYDMAKAYSKSMEISRICLLEKSGGRSGDYRKK